MRGECYWEGVIDGKTVLTDPSRQLLSDLQNFDSLGVSEEKIFGSFDDIHSGQLKVFVCLFWISFGGFRKDLENDQKKIL